MKTTVKTMDYESVMNLPRPKRKVPRKINIFWRLLIRFLCPFGLMGTKFQYKLDLEGIEYISSAGLRVLLSAQKKMQSIGTMTVKNVCEEVMEIFEMTGFADILVIE